MSKRIEKKYLLDLIIRKSSFTKLFYIKTKKSFTEIRPVFFFSYIVEGVGIVHLRTNMFPPQIFSES